MQKLWQKYTVERTCEECEKVFNAYIHNVKKGFGRYCSRACRNMGAKLGFQEGHGKLRSDESYKNSNLPLEGNHWAWKGERAGKIAKHAFIERLKGKPKECEFCGQNNPNKYYDWANVDHQYSRNPDDYIRLCRSCHRKYDYGNLNIITSADIKLCVAHS